MLVGFDQFHSVPNLLKLFKSGNGPLILRDRDLRDELELANVTLSGVYTFFNSLSWPVPADLKNVLQQAGTEGWLDTADSEDIKITSLGENLVEYELPKKT